MIPRTQWGFACLLALLSAIALWSIWQIVGVSYLCKLPVFVSEEARNAPCFKFWFNRYQQLIAGLLALVAAGAAAWLVWRQFRSMESGRALMIQNAIILRAGYLQQFGALASGCEHIARGLSDFAENVGNAWSGGLHNLLQELSVLIERIERMADTFVAGPEPTESLRFFGAKLKEVEGEVRSIAYHPMCIAVVRGDTGQTVQFAALVSGLGPSAAALVNLAGEIRRAAETNRARLFRQLVELERHMRAETSA